LKKIVLISVGQPSTNPRLVKEANTLAEIGFDVYVIYSFWTKWAYDADKELFSKIRWTPILVGGSPFEHRFRYFFTRVRVKLFMLMAQKLTLRLGIAEIARGRAYPELLKKAQSIKADLYIAHIQAALPAAVIAAQKNNSRCGFDAEDFHRQEVSDDNSSFNYLISKYIEDKYLPLVDYITAASPLIAESYAGLYRRKVTSILNVFPKSAICPINNKNKPLKLFWFSQTIGPNRGLEVVIEALKLSQSYNFELHLLGNIEPMNKLYFTDRLQTNNTKLYFHAPVLAENLISFGSAYDIGLAAENTIPLNRDICLTNKIFTYMQSGLAIAASKTSAQSALIGQYSQVGGIYKDASDLAKLLTAYDADRSLLWQTKQASYHLGQTQFNWENESQLFLNVIKETLQKIEF
jgi:glycosyltransferase involved in cell wall biosynthesis